MYTILLSAGSEGVPSLGAFETLTQYGALGVVVLGLGAVLWFMLKRQIASEDRLKARVDELEKELKEYIKNDQNQLRSIIENNTRTVESFKELLLTRKSK
jgi:uncharacterized protein HemX